MQTVRREWGGAWRSGRGGAFCLALTARLAECVLTPAVAALPGARVGTLYVPRERVAVASGVWRSFCRLECLCEGAEVTLGVVVASRVVVVEDAEYHVS